MSYHRTPYASLAVVLVFASAIACSGDSKGALNSDSTLQRDLTNAANALPAAQPDLRDVPQTPPVQTPAQRRPAPTRPPQTPPVAPPPAAVTPPAAIPAPTATAAAAPAPAVGARRGTVAAGTNLSLAVDQKVCTSAKPGDKLMATLTEGVVGNNGALIPSGSRVVVEVASVAQGSGGDLPKMTFRATTLIMGSDRYPVVGDATPTDTLEKVRAEGQMSDKKKVAGGAIAGALIGQVIGKNTKGTVVGAAAGAAAGAVAAKAGAKYEGCLNQNSHIRLVLAQPLEIAVK
jgi:hypothetical protein